MTRLLDQTPWYTVLMDLNWDRLLYIITIAAALWAGSFLGTFV